MKAILLFLVGLVVAEASISDYVQLQQSCDPAVQNDGIVNDNNRGKVCFPGSECNPRTKICDCADGGMKKEWKRTWEEGQCKLLPGSTCVPVDQDYYRCVTGARCTQTRVGEDPRKCLADAPCDTGDWNCVCQPGKDCLNEKRTAPPK